MAGKKTITNLSELTSAASNDVVPVVDVSDQSVTSSGETKKITVTNLLSGKADSSHTHAISDVTNLQTSLDAKQDAPSEGAFANGDKTKLDGIEALADVTDATNVEAAGALMDSELTDLAGVKGVTISTLQPKPSEGAFVNGDKTKLDGVESGATADQSDSEIKTAYENNADTNAFTDADHTKLDGIESSATADQTGAEIKSLYESESDTNAFTDADHTKLDGIESGATADQTASEIKTAYESNSDTNAFTDADHTKLDGIAASANNYSHPNHSGEVTSTGDGATVIADNVVDEANLKVSNSPTDGYSLVARSGETGGLKWESVSGGTPAGSTGAIQFHDGSGFGGSSSLIWDNTLSRLGVGTGSPSQKLHVSSGNILIDNNQSYRSKNTSGIVRSLLTLYTDNNLYVQSPSDITFQTNQDVSTINAMTIDSSGNVGVGTGSSVLAKLHVRGNSDTSEHDCSIRIVDADGTSSSADPNLQFWTDSGQLYQIRANDSSGLQFRNSSDVTKITFDDDGKVGIGTSSPSAPIDVSGATNDGNSLSEFTQTGTGRGLSVLRNVESATRQMVAFAQTHASGGSQPVVHIQQADSDEIALGIDISGTVSSPTFSVKGNGEVVTDGNVGIGTGSSGPQASLHVVDTTDPVIRVQNTSANPANGGAIHFAESTGSDGFKIQHDGSNNRLNFEYVASSTEYIFFTLQRNSGRLTVKKSSNAEVTALTDGATITPDFDDANNFSVTLGGNRTLANPSNCTAGQSGVITITQDGTGSRTLAYGAYWKFSGGTAPTLTTTASAVDVLAYYVESATRITATLITDTK